MDDKIIAVLEQDGAYGGWRDLSDCPQPLLDRLQHYFLTYKAAPGSAPSGDRFIVEAYGRAEAYEVIRRSQEDYREKFPALCRSFEQWQKWAASR